MKVGSIVKCIKPAGYDNEPNVVSPKVNSIYMIRSFWGKPINGYKPSLYLEEIINNKNMFGVEPSFYMGSFVELLPPEACSLEELLEEIQEEELI